MSNKIQVQVWQTNAHATKVLKKRLQDAMRKQVDLVAQWEANMGAVYGTRDRLDARISFQSHVEALQNNMEYADDVNINYVFKHLRLIHAQMSANPPSVVARPTSSDSDDRRKADAADRLVRHAMRQYKLGEKFDQCSLFALVTGTGVIKTMWNPLGGDIAEYDEESGSVEMEGDISISTPSTFDLFLDAAARTVDDVRFVFERIWVPLEDAISRWPEQEEALRTSVRNATEYRLKYHNPENTEMVELFEYWEKGLPQNAMLGRFAIITKEGLIIESPRPNPFRFSPTMTPREKARKARMEEAGREYVAPPPTAYLPYHFLTDVDVPGIPFGKSFVEYEANIQDVINKLDSTQLENIKAHGISRLVVMEGSEMSDDSLTNSAWDVVKITGNQPPAFMTPPGQFPDSVDLRSKLQQGGDDMAGVNDAMFGNMKRETAGFTMQYSVNQGNMVRRRLFNKYTQAVESCYKAIINLVVKHWTDTKTVYVLGSERAFEAMDLKGTDVNGGFDLVVEYGASLSLDPQSRREEIMQLLPLFEKAGVDTKTILGMLRLNELEGMYDIMQLSAERQREIFEEMIATGGYIKPRELQEHQGMLQFAYRYLMTSEYKYLPANLQVLIEQHIKAREELAAKSAAPSGGGVGSSAVPTGMPPLPGLSVGGSGAAPAPAVGM